MWKGQGGKCPERVADRKVGQRRGISLPSLPPTLSQIAYSFVFSSCLHCWSDARSVDTAGRLYGRVRGNDHDRASSPLLFSHSHFLPMAENSSVPLAYLSEERCPAQLRGQWDRSERPLRQKEAGPECAHGRLKDRDAGRSKAAAHALVCQWCGGRMMWDGAVPRAASCLPLSALGLGSVCAHQHEYGLLKLSGHACLCKTMVP